MPSILDKTAIDWRSRASLLRGLLYLLIFGGCLLRVWIIWRYNPLDHIWSDPERHWVQGMETLRSDPLSLSDPIMYQLFIGALAKLTLKLPLLVWFYTSLLSLLTPWIWYRFFRELQPDKTIALAACVLVAWLPSWISIYSYFMNETLMLPLLGAALYTSWRARRKQTTGSFVLMVALWSIVGLTRAICIPMAALTCAWIWFRHPRKIHTLIYSLLLLVTLLGPLTYRGYKMMHVFSPYGVGGMNSIYAVSGKKEVKITYHRDGAIWYFGFMSPSLLIEPLAPWSHWKTKREGTVNIDVDINGGAQSWEKAKSLWKFDFNRYVWTTGENLIFLFFGPSWPDDNHARLLDEINYRSRWMWVPLTLVMCVWTVSAIRAKQCEVLLPAIILVWLVTQGLLPLVPSEGRYRKPYEGLLLAQLVLLVGVTRERRN